jgi:hypothetical protein
MTRQQALCRPLSYDHATPYCPIRHSWDCAAKDDCASLWLRGSYVEFWAFRMRGLVNSKRGVGDV